MAEEPSWEDIFNPNPTPKEPAAPTPPPLVEPPQAYPPTLAYPAQPAAPSYPQTQAYPPTQAYPADTYQAPGGQAPAGQAPGAAAPAAQPPARPIPASPAPAAQPPAAPSDDPFAGLFATPQPASPQPAAPQPAAPQPAAPQPDWFQPVSAQPPQSATPQPAWPQPGAAQPAAAAPATPAHEYTPEPPFPTTATARFTPREEDDPFAALFGASAAPTAAPAAQASAADGSQPLSRREAREGEGRRSSIEPEPMRAAGAGGSGGGGRDDGYGYGGGGGGGKPRKKRSRRWLKITLPIVIVLALVGGVGAYGWFNYNEQVRALLGIPLPTDYTGNGNGKEVIVTVKSGDIGEDIAHTLHDKGVTLTFDAFYNLLLEQKEQPDFQPGNFKLQQHMSAAAALKALLDPNNKVTDKLLITEGTTLPDALQTIADTTGISLADLQTASQDLAGLGVPTTEHTLEGWLFPATYQLDGGLTAHDVLQLLVNTMIEHLDAAGVPVDQRHNVLTLASVIQRESGPNTDDFYKISRVFTNRMEQGINLESDATVAYGTGNLNTVYTTDEERADATNPYNTYANPGLPVGPIGLPGDLAIDAALHPVDGPWLFFVPINLQTGETVFSETVDEHDAAVEQLHEWCAASPENDSYCQ